MSEAQSELDGLRSLDAQALAAVHERYFPELFRYARFRIGDPAAAEDLASEALVRLLEAVHAGRGPRSSLRGWLMGTLANLVSDHFRRSYARPTGALPEDQPSDGPDPSALAEGREQELSLRRALGQLTAEQQHVLALRFSSGHSVDEAAMIMGKSANAVKALQFRALVALRRHLADEAQ